MSNEIGAASLLIELEDGIITAYHGDDKTVLGEKRETRAGDWDRLIEALKGVGIKWRYK